MLLHHYVRDNAVRGACMCGKCADAPEHPEQLQPKDSEHSADLVFFKVGLGLIAHPDKKKFLQLVSEEFPHWLDGKEHSYLEMGANMGDQGIALMTMGLGKILGVWELLTPKSVLGDIPEDMAMMMAGRGMITVKFDRAVENM